MKPIVAFGEICSVYVYEVDGNVTVTVRPGSLTETVVAALQAPVEFWEAVPVPVEGAPNAIGETVTLLQPGSGEHAIAALQALPFIEDAHYLNEEPETTE